MAIFTFLFSFIARKANDIVQAVFGWSITALFGRLRRRQQILVTSALVVSLAWPLFVLGTFAPAVASWAVAMVPFHHWLGDNGIRIVWISLAVLAPLAVGLLVHLAVPTSRTSVVTSLVHGYPIATGFFLAFVVIVVTVPILKIASLVRRWSDEHVFVQPHDDDYDAVLDCLVEACTRAGLTPAISDAPRTMVLATTIMRTLAASAVSPFVANKLRRVTADGIEMYLYPGDLLLRGKTFQVSKVRALLTRTDLDARAYLVESPRAQELQDELSKLVDETESRASVGVTVTTQLQDVYRAAMEADISYPDWIALDALARKIERRLIAKRTVSGSELPIDAVADSWSAKGSRHLSGSYNARTTVPGEFARS